jgi:hypothetical protein
MNLITNTNKERDNSPLFTEAIFVLIAQRAIKTEEGERIKDKQTGSRKEGMSQVDWSDKDNEINSQLNHDDQPRKRRG